MSANTAAQRPDSPEPEIADDQYEIKVSITVGLPHRGPRHPGTHDSMELIYDALVQSGKLPDGTKLYAIEARVSDAKDLRRRARRIARERAKDNVQLGKAS